MSDPDNSDRHKHDMPFSAEDLTAQPPTDRDGVQAASDNSSKAISPQDFYSRLIEREQIREMLSRLAKR